MTQDFLVNFFASLGVVVYLYAFKWVYDSHKELEAQRKRHEIEIVELIQSIKKVKEAKEKYDSR